MIYEILDKAIIDAISKGKIPTDCFHVNNEAWRLEHLTDRYDFNIIKCRMQALRKAGKIKYIRSVDDKGRVGWVIV